jgi:sugar lactone lactonase YvrE
MSLLLLLLACPPPEDPPSCDTPGVVCTIAGTGLAGLSDIGACAEDSPTYLVLDSRVGPDGWLWYLDWNNHQILRIDLSDTDGCRTIDLVTGTTLLGDGPEGPAEAAAWNHPTDLAWGPDGRMYVAAWHNSRVITYDPADDSVAFFAGTGARNYNGEELPALETVLDLPAGVAFDDDGLLYIADQANQRVRQVGQDGLVRTVVGTGQYGYNGDELPADEALLFNELSQAASPAGKLAFDGPDLYIADTGNARVRRVSMDDGLIHTFAGSGTLGYAGDGGPAAEAQLSNVRDVAVGPDGTVYIADTGNHCVRAVDPGGTMRTVAGVCGTQGYAGDGAPATEALFSGPFGVEVAADGALYIADTYNNVLRRVAP